MKKIVSFIIALCILALPVRVYVEDITSNDLETDLREKIYGRIERDELPEVQAWETDLSGNTSAVTPLYKRNVNRRAADSGIYISVL